jgi:MFS transporter, putative metabolite transport protein
MTTVPAVPAADATGIDDAATHRFHLRMSAFVGGGQFIDGYILGVIAIALVLIPSSFGLTPLWMGLIGSSALIGLFVGGIACGWVTDLIGRKALYTIDLVVFLVGSVAQFFVTSPWELFAIRVLIGLAIGADYAVGPTYLAEFVPRVSRSRLLGSLVGMFFVGYILSLGVGVLGRGWGPDGWRWVLASSAVPAAIVLLLRLGSPESPRWLAGKGRLEEALAICRRYIGEHVSADDLLGESTAPPSFRKLLSGAWLRRVIFVGVFWSALAWPEFAIFTFLPTVLKTIGIPNGDVSTFLIRLLSLAGFGAGLLMVALVGRRGMLIWSLGILTAVFLLLGALGSPPGWLVVALFAVFSLVSGFVAPLEFLYPAELFPTDIRGSGVGLGSALSRVGAVAGTFLLPLILAGPGLQFAMLVTAVVVAVGAAVTLLWAPETRGVALREASLG